MNFGPIQHAAPPTGATAAGMFSPASGIGKDRDLIPHGTYAWAILNVQNVKPSKTGGQYLDIKLTIAEGPYERRVIFDRIMDPLWADNSEGARQMGLMALTRICECAGIFSADPQSYRQFDNADIETIARAIDGARVGVRIKVDKQQGFDDKNCISEWLSPNPESHGNKGFLKLVGGADKQVQARASAFGVATSPVSPGFPQQAAPAAAPQPQAPPPVPQQQMMYPPAQQAQQPGQVGAKPSWLNKP